MKATLIATAVSVRRQTYENELRRSNVRHRTDNRRPGDDVLRQSASWSLVAARSEVIWELPLKGDPDSPPRSD